MSSYLNGWLIALKNSEFIIGESDISSCAYLDSDSYYNLPSETSVEMKDGELFYAGGSDYSFKCEKFEVYGIEV